MAISYQRKLGDGTIVIDSGTSNVGIGTNDPIYKLEVKGDVDTWVAGIHNTGSDVNAQGLLVRSDATAAHNSSVFGVYADGGYKVMVKSSGNVGIGTTDPDKKLDIKLADTSSGTYYAQTIGGSNHLTGYAVGIGFDPEGYGNRNKVGIIVEGTGSGWSTGHMHFVSKSDTGTGSDDEATISDARMTITSNGNVGIGVTGPSEILQIKSGRADILLESTTAGQATRYRLKTTSREWRIGTNSTKSDSFWIFDGDATSYRLEISTSGQLKLPAYGAGGFKGDATYVLGVDSSGNVVETTTAGVYFGTNTSNGTYTNQWQRVLVIDTGNFDSQGFRLRIEGTGNTSGQSIVAEIEFNYKNQNGAIRARTTVNSYGTSPVDKDDVAVYFDTTNLEATFYFKVKENYTAPIYSIVSGRIRNYAFYSNVIGDDTALASETNDSITSNLKFQGIVQDQDSGLVGIGTSSPSGKLHIQTDASSEFIFTGASTSGYTTTFHMDNTGLDIGHNSTGRSLNLKTGSLDRLTITGAGNVGIGTTSPSGKLTIKSPGDVDTYGDAFVVERAGTTAKLVRIYEDAADGFLEVRTGADDIVTKLSGYSGTPSYFLSTVGIGTSNPGQTLTVKGSLGIQRTSNTETSYIDMEGNLNVYAAPYNYSVIFHTGTGGTSSEKMRIDYGGNVGIGTTTPDAHLEISANAGADPSPITNPVTLRLTDAGSAATGQGDTTNPWAKIEFYSEDQSSGGPAVQAQISTIYDDIYSAGSHISFSNTSTPTNGLSEKMRINSNGTIRFNSYGAGFLQTDANGNITAGTVTTSDTLDDVTDNGNSTTNSIILGDSTTNGTMLVRGSYASGNIVVIGGMKSSGGAMIGYAVKPDTANNHGFVSSSAYTLERAAYYQQGNRHRWYAGASQNAAIGNAVTISETMRLDFDKLGLSTSSPASLIHLGKPTNGANIITFGEAGIGGPHGLDFYGDDATRTKKFSIYYRTGTENISIEDGGGTKRWEITQSGAVTFNQAFTFPTADGSAGAALVTNGSGSLSWGGGYQQYTPVGWGILNNQTYTSTGANISSSSTQAQSGTTPVQRNSATEFEATKAGWYEISYSFIVKNNYANRAMVGAYMSVSTSGGGGIINGSHSTQYVRYTTYGEYAQIQNTFYYYTSYSSTLFYLYAYLLSGSMNMTTQAISQSMISFRYINNDIT